MWWIVLTVIFVALALLAAFTMVYHLKIKFTKILFFILTLFLISSFIVIILNDIDITEKGGITGFATSYFDWMKQIGSNIGEITGQVITQDWAPN